MNVKLTDKIDIVISEPQISQARENSARINDDLKKERSDYAAIIGTAPYLDYLLVPLFGRVFCNAMIYLPREIPPRLAP